MNYFKLPLLVLSLSVPLVIGTFSQTPAFSNPIIAQSRTISAQQLAEQGMAYIDKQQWNMAMSMFNQAIAADPSYPYGYIGRAVVTILRTKNPTLSTVQGVEKDLKIALSLLDPYADREAYQNVYYALEEVQALRLALQ